MLPALASILPSLVKSDRMIKAVYCEPMNIDIKSHAAKLTYVLPDEGNYMACSTSIFNVRVISPSIARS